MKDEQGLDLVRRETRLICWMTKSDHGRSVEFRLENGSDRVLWSPHQSAPAYRLDARNRVARLWFGYFQEVFAGSTGEYVPEEMAMIPEGNSAGWSLTEKTVLAAAFDDGYRIAASIRLSLQEPKRLRTRGGLNLEEFLKNTFVLATDQPV